MDIHQWLNEAKAKDVMTTEVITVKAKDSLHAAAEVFIEEQISGAPVVDDAGACVGVITANDFLGAECDVTDDDRQKVKSSFYDSSLFLHTWSYARNLKSVRERVAASDDATVDKFMTTDIVSVDADDPLSKVAQFIIDAHIHRVLVLDEGRQLQGIISSTDLLADLLVSDRQSIA